MKIYLVNADNGQSYEDYDHRVIAAFTTFRGASQSLIDKGYEPYADRDFKTGDLCVCFSFSFIDEDDWENSSEAWITEMELQG